MIIRKEHALKTDSLASLHPNDVFYAFVSHWQPDPEAANPEMPGRKAMMTMVIPAKPGMQCVCGSGKLFTACCKRKNYWIPVCVNPDFMGYGKLESYQVTYRPTDCMVLKSRLTADERFRCNVDSDESSHWLFHNNSPHRFTEYGEINLGDIELSADGSLQVTAMSTPRMMALREILESEYGLSDPEIEVDSGRRRIPKPLRMVDMLPGISKAVEESRKIMVS